MMCDVGVVRVKSESEESSHDASRSTHVITTLSNPVLST